MLVEVADIEPLATEVDGESPRAVVVKHAPGFADQDLVGECFVASHGQQVDVGSGGAQEVGEAGGHLPVVDRSLRGFQGGCFGFIEEGGGVEEAGEGEAAGLLMGKFLCPETGVECRDGLQFFAGEWSAVEGGGKCREGLQMPLFG